MRRSLIDISFWTALVFQACGCSGLYNPSQIQIESVSVKNDEARIKLRVPLESVYSTAGVKVACNGDEVQISVGRKSIYSSDRSFGFVPEMIAFSLRTEESQIILTDGIHRRVLWVKSH